MGPGNEQQEPARGAAPEPGEPQAEMSEAEQIRLEKRRRNALAAKKYRQKKKTKHGKAWLDREAKRQEKYRPGPRREKLILPLVEDLPQNQDSESGQAHPDVMELAADAVVQSLVSKRKGEGSSKRVFNEPIPSCSHDYEEESPENGDNQQSSPTKQSNEATGYGYGQDSTVHPTTLTRPRPTNKPGSTKRKTKAKDNNSPDDVNVGEIPDPDTTEGEPSYEEKTEDSIDSPNASIDEETLHQQEGPNPTTGKDVTSLSNGTIDVEKPMESGVSKDMKKGGANSTGKNQEKTTKTPCIKTPPTKPVQAKKGTKPKNKTSPKKAVARRPRCPRKKQDETSMNKEIEENELSLSSKASVTPKAASGSEKQVNRKQRNGRKKSSLLEDKRKETEESSNMEESSTCTTVGNAAETTSEERKRAVSSKKSPTERGPKGKKQVTPENTIQNAVDPQEKENPSDDQQDKDDSALSPKGKRNNSQGKERATSKRKIPQTLEPAVQEDGHSSVSVVSDLILETTGETCIKTAPTKRGPAQKGTKMSKKKTGGKRPQTKPGARKTMDDTSEGSETDQTDPNLDISNTMNTVHNRKASNRKPAPRKMSDSPYEGGEDDESLLDLGDSTDERSAATPSPTQKKPATSKVTATKTVKRKKPQPKKRKSPNVSLEEDSLLDMSHTKPEQKKRKTQKRKIDPLFEEELSLEGNMDSDNEPTRQSKRRRTNELDDTSNNNTSMQSEDGTDTPLSKRRCTALSPIYPNDAVFRTPAGQGLKEPPTSSPLSPSPKHRTTVKAGASTSFLSAEDNTPVLTARQKRKLKKQDPSSPFNRTLLDSSASGAENNRSVDSVDEPLPQIVQECLARRQTKEGVMLGGKDDEVMRDPLPTSLPPSVLKRTPTIWTRDEPLTRKALRVLPPPKQHTGKATVGGKAKISTAPDE